MIPQIQFYKSHPLNFVKFDEDVIFVGGKGEGKTTHLKNFISQVLPETPYWIWDFSNQLHGFGNLVHKVEDLEYGQFVIQARDKSKENYGRFLDKARLEMHDLIVITDELHQYTHKNEIWNPLYNLVLSARNQGVVSIFATTRPASVPNYILSNLTHVFARPLKLQSDIEWLVEYIGLESWLLLPKDKRKKYFVDIDSPEILPRHKSYLYRNLNEANTYVISQ